MIKKPPLNGVLFGGPYAPKFELFKRFKIVFLSCEKVTIFISSITSNSVWTTNNK